MDSNRPVYSVHEVIRLGKRAGFDWYDLVHPPEASPLGMAAPYARVSSADQKADFVLGCMVGVQL